MANLSQEEKDKIVEQAISDFDDVKAAMEEKGLEVPEGTDTSAYGNLIRSLYVGGIVDQTYDPEGINPLSGKAVAEALKTIHVTYLESTDSENYLNLFDLESGTYILQGVFYVYPNAPKRYTFSKRVLVSVSHGTKSTCVQVFYPPWNTIQYLNIWTDEESETGYSYERKDAELYYMEDTRNKVTSLDENADDEHYPSALAVKKAVGNASNALKANASGEVIRVDDVSPIEHSVKAKVKSKNLIKFPFGQKSYTKDGVTFTVDEETQTVIVNGTPTVNISFAYSYGNANSFKVEKGKTYTLSCQSLLSDSRGYIYLQVIDGETTHNSVSVMNGKITFVANGDGYAAIGLVVLKNVTYENETVVVQVEAGDTATEYEPYIDPTTVSVKRYGKNILCPNGLSSTNKGVTFTNNGDGSFTIKGTSTGNLSFPISDLQIMPLGLKKGVTYTQSLIRVSGNNPQAAVVPSVKDSEGNITYNYLSNNQTKTADKDYSFYAYTIYLPTDITVDMTFKVQLEIGDTVTDYNDYQACETYTPNADGTLDIVSVSPTMTLLTDTAGVNIDLEYNQDSNKAIENVNKDITTLDNDMAVLKANMGDIDTALDELHAYAQSLKGGVAE